MPIEARVDAVLVRARSRGPGRPPATMRGSAPLAFPRLSTSRRRQLPPAGAVAATEVERGLVTRRRVDDGNVDDQRLDRRLRHGGRARRRGRSHGVGLDVVERDRRRGTGYRVRLGGDQVDDPVVGPGRGRTPELAEAAGLVADPASRTREAGDDAAAWDARSQQRAEHAETGEHDRRTDDAGRGRERLRDRGPEEAAGVAEPVDRAVDRGAAAGEVEDADRGEAEQRDAEADPPRCRLDRLLERAVTGGDRPRRRSPARPRRRAGPAVRLGSTARRRRRRRRARRSGPARRSRRKHRPGRTRPRPRSPDASPSVVSAARTRRPTATASARCPLSWRPAASRWRSQADGGGAERRVRGAGAARRFRAALVWRFFAGRLTPRAGPRRHRATLTPAPPATTGPRNPALQDGGLWVDPPW